MTISVRAVEAHAEVSASSGAGVGVILTSNPTAASAVVEFCVSVTPRFADASPGASVTEDALSWLVTLAGRPSTLS